MGLHWWRDQSPLRSFVDISYQYYSTSMTIHPTNYVLALWSKIWQYLSARLQLVRAQFINVVLIFRKNWLGIGHVSKLDQKLISTLAEHGSAFGSEEWIFKFTGHSTYIRSTRSWWLWRPHRALHNHRCTSKCEQSRPVHRPRRGMSLLALGEYL